jgi:hypothetical protein
VIGEAVGTPLKTPETVAPSISSCTRWIEASPVSVRTSCESRASRLRASPPVVKRGLRSTVARSPFTVSAFTVVPAGT